MESILDCIHDPVAEIMTHALLLGEHIQLHGDFDLFVSFGISYGGIINDAGQVAAVKIVVKDGDILDWSIGKEIDICIWTLLEVSVTYRFSARPISASINPLTYWRTSAQALTSNFLCIVKLC